MSKYLKDYAWLALLVGIIVGLDQWSKALVRNNLQFSYTWVPWDWLAPYARIVNWKNTGAAFGLGQNLNPNTALMILAIIVIVMILYYYPQIPRTDWPLRLALGLQISGALGNLIDRIARGFVTDFVSIGSFAVFNIADSSISIGVVVLIIGMWVQERKTNAAQQESEHVAEELENSVIVKDSLNLQNH